MTHFGHECIGGVGVFSILIKISNKRSLPLVLLLPSLSWPVQSQSNSLWQHKELPSRAGSGTIILCFLFLFSVFLSFFLCNFIPFSLTLYTFFPLLSVRLADFKKTQSLSCWKNIQLLVTELMKPSAVKCWNRRQMTASHVFLTVPLPSRAESPSSNSPWLNERNFCFVRSVQLFGGRPLKRLYKNCKGPF